MNHVPPDQTVDHADYFDVSWDYRKDVLCAQRTSAASFRVYYAEHKATVDIRTCELMESNLPRKQTKLVLAWAELRQEELMADWSLVMNGEEPFKIQPLQ